jgi:hypothetical protein
MVYQKIPGFACYGLPIQKLFFPVSLFFSPLQKRFKTNSGETREHNRNFHLNTLVYWPHFKMTVMLLICISNIIL